MDKSAINVLRDFVPFVHLKNVKITHEGVLLLVKFATLLKKVTLLHGCFPRFLNCTNGTKSRNTSQMTYLTRLFLEET